MPKSEPLHIFATDDNGNTSLLRYIIDFSAEAKVRRENVHLHWPRHPTGFIDAG